MPRQAGTTLIYRLLVIGFFGVIAAPSSPASANESSVAGECGDVVLAEFSWATAGLASRLLELVLTDGYGCDARRLPATPDRAAHAVADADKQMRAAMARAAPLDAAPLDAPPAVIAVGAQSFSEKGVSIGAELYGGMDRGGWFAPSWLTASHPGLRRIEDILERPEIFTHSATAKPKLHICPKAWPCHADDLALIDQLGLKERFEIVIPASGDALTASLVDAWRHRRPWLGSYWTPSAAVAEHAMTRLESGALEICPSQGRGEAASDVACRPPHRSPPSVTLYPEALEARAPRVASLLRRFALPPEVALDALAWRATSNADLDDAALQLLDSRPGLWRTWLDAAARERFELALNERLKAADARAAEAQARRQLELGRLKKQRALQADHAPNENRTRASDAGSSAQPRPEG